MATGWRRRKSIDEKHKSAEDNISTEGAGAVVAISIAGVNVGFDVMLAALLYKAVLNRDEKEGVAWETGGLKSLLDVSGPRTS